jgi:hypothetical protein
VGATDWLQGCSLRSSQLRIVFDGLRLSHKMRLTHSAILFLLYIFVSSLFSFVFGFFLFNPVFPL